MSIEIGLQRITTTGSPDPAVLHKIRCVVQRVLAESNLQDDTTMADDRKSFTVLVPGGTARIHDSFAIFPLTKLDPLWLRIVYSVAKAGDMVVAGDSLAILTDSAQPRPTWVSASALVPVCSSPDELRTALEPWLNEQRGYADAMRRELSLENPTNSAGQIPGSSETPNLSVIYVELGSGEAIMAFLDSFGRFSRVFRRDNAENKPKSGGHSGTAWLLRTPSSELFTALNVKGDTDWWLNLVRSFASSQSRLLGRISAGMFVINDGRRFAIDECTCERSKG
jgi:hypothetical protein